MRDHHRELIAREAEAWRTTPRQPTTERDVYSYDSGDGLVVVLMESVNRNSRIVTVHFPGDEMPLTARMIRDRLADPFGGPT